MKKLIKMILFLSMLLIIIFYFNQSKIEKIIFSEKAVVGALNKTSLNEKIIQVTKIQQIISELVEESLTQTLNNNLPIINPDCRIEVVEIKPVVNKPFIVDFDRIFKVANAGVSNMQLLLDSGYIVFYYGDYFHHNNSKFMNLFWQCSNFGTKIKLDNKFYISNGIYHGWNDSTYIYYDDGAVAWEDYSRIELITCDGFNTNKRWILVLIPE